jgi:L,D-transpeptidase ErfK/SrfK
MHMLDKPIFFALIAAMLLSAPTYAQEPITRPKAQTEKAPAAPVKKPAKKTKAAAKKTAPAPDIAAAEALTPVDTDETFNLPEYQLGARISVGKMQTYHTAEEDTFLDIARHFGLGYVELRAANPAVDPWSPVPGTELTIPSFNLLPRARQEGVVVNLGKMRLYYFRDPGKPPLTYAIGIGREGLSTPVGRTTVVRKTAGPSWYPTERMRKEKTWLPAAIPPGASNPLGTHALYLGWPTFLIHGSNKPWGIGRRVSSGCMRMYPEDVTKFFDMVPVGTKVTVVDQPILVGWLDDGLYLEANPSQTQSSQLEFDEQMEERPLTSDLRRVIEDAAGPAASGRIDWTTVEKVVRERSGYPVLIAPARKKDERRQQATEYKNNWNQ